MRKVCAHTVPRTGETVAGVAGQWENSVCTACQEDETVHVRVVRENARERIGQRQRRRMRL